MAKRSLKHLIKNFGRAGEIVECMRSTPQWSDLTLAYLGIKPLSFPFLFRTRSGLKMELNTFHDLVTIWVIFFRKEYKVPKNASVVIDAGANIGSFSIFASTQEVQKIYAIEPFPETNAELLKNLKMNQLENLVEVKEIALADNTGTRCMDISEGPSQSRGVFEEGTTEEGLQVSTMTLADFLTSTGQESIDLLKIDIEGGEHEVFHSSTDETLQKIKKITMEYHPNASKEKLFERVLKAGFQLTFDFKISSDSGVAYFDRA